MRRACGDRHLPCLLSLTNRGNKSLDRSGGASELRISNCGFEIAPPRELNRETCRSGGTLHLLIKLDVSCANEQITSLPSKQMFRRKNLLSQRSVRLEINAGRRTLSQKG
jgi:hypothetical protein